jgi:predicted phosphoribosyltransferase
LAYFTDRIDAGKKLALTLKDFKGNGIVLAIPRGGVVVGYVIAKELGQPLDVIIPRKIGAPDNPELAIGAVAEDGTALTTANSYLGVSPNTLKKKTSAKNGNSETKFTGKMQATDEGLDVIIVDDGIATGSTMKAALASVKNRGAVSVTVAVPVGPPQTIEELEKMADREGVCTPEFFHNIGP